MVEIIRTPDTGDLGPMYCQDCGYDVDSCGWGAARCNSPDTAMGELNRVISQGIIEENVASTTPDQEDKA